MDVYGHGSFCEVLALYRKAGTETRQLAVYDSLDELPGEIKISVRNNRSSLTPKVDEAEAKTNCIYVILKNSDSTEGAGKEYIWVLTTNRQLAVRLSRGNGPSGGNATVRLLPLDKNLSDDENSWSVFVKKH